VTTDWALCWSDGWRKAAGISASTPETPWNAIWGESFGKTRTRCCQDAAHLGSTPGEHAILSTGELAGVGFSTHQFPLKMQLEELARSLSSRIYLLAVQPRSLELGKKVCGEVRRSLQRLEKRITKALAVA
jgi:hypothetical protein